MEWIVPLFFIDNINTEIKMRLKKYLVAASIAACSMTGIASMSQIETFAATAQTEAKATSKTSGNSTTKTDTKTTTTTKEAAKTDSKSSAKTTDKASADTSTKTTDKKTDTSSSTSAKITEKSSTKSTEPSPAKTTGKSSEKETPKKVNVSIEGKTFEVSATGYAWIYVNGYYHFVQNGKLVTGWKLLTKAEGEKTDHWSYFDKKNGRIYTGWRKMGAAEGEKTEHWSYFGNNGWIRTGWQLMGKGTSNPDGNATAHWSYFGPNGWLRTGWQVMGTSSNPDGKNKVHWSYFGGNGWMVKGWYKNSEGLHYFKSNGWMCASETAKIDQSEYKFNSRGILTGVDHTGFKYINQYKTYGYYPMSCGSSSSLMAMQAAGYCKGLDTKGEYEDYLSTWRAVCGKSFGTKGGVGASLPSKVVNVVKNENTTRGVPVKGVTNGSLNADYLKDSLTHGQTSIVIIQNFKVYTHWIAITGWEMKGNELVFKIADPLPSDCGRGAASSVTKVTQGNLGTSMKNSKLFSLIDAKIVKIFHGGRCGVTFGNYKSLNSYY